MKMVKIICIKKAYNHYNFAKNDLTIGKEYEYVNGDFVYKHAGEVYIFVKDDKDYWDYYPKKCFITKDEYRHKKLEELGI